MKNKFFSLQCICTIIILSIFCGCDSNLERVAKMEDMILCVLNKENYIERDFSLAYTPESDLFTSDFESSEDVEHLLMSIRDEWNLESITYIGHNWFRLTYDFSDKKQHYWKIVEEDNKFKLGDIAYAYSQCISQINDLSYVDRIRYKFNSIKYDDVQPYFQGSLCKVSNKGKFGFINSKGEKIIPCIYDYVAFVLGDIFESRFRADCQDNLLQVKLNNKFGFLNLEGKEIIPCKYDDVTIFDGWENMLLQVKLENKYGLINSEGKEIIPCKYDSICNQDWEWLDVKLDGKYGMIDFEGKEIIPCKYDSIGNHAWEWLDAKLDGKYGILDFEGKEIIPCKYDDLKGLDLYLYHLDNLDWCYGLFLVRLNGKYGMINFEEKEIIPCLFEYIVPSENGKLLKVRKENLWSYYKIDGTQATDFYEDIECYDDIEHPIFAAKSNGKWGYLNEAGDVLISFVLDYAGEPHDDGTAYVKYEGRSAELDLYSRTISYYYNSNDYNTGSSGSYPKKKCSYCKGYGSTGITDSEGRYRGRTRCSHCGGLGYTMSY